MKDNFDIFFRRKPAMILVALKKNLRNRYGSVLAKEVDCTYSHAVKILQEMEKARLVVHYLEKLNTKMMLIDEIHSSLRGNLNKQRSFIDTLKQLSNKLSLSIVLAGTKEAHSALSIGGETASRFPSLELPRWSNDKKFRSFLGTYESCLPLKEASNLALDQQLVDILYNQSEGLIGRTVNLLKKAAVNAIKSKREKIIIDDIVYLPTL